MSLSSSDYIMTSFFWYPNNNVIKGKIFHLGRNKKLGLTGRKSRDVGILSTSKLYSLQDRIFAFTPQVSMK